MLIKTALLVFFMLLPSWVLAQSADSKTQDKDHGTYLKAQLAHWQKILFEGNNLFEWSGNLFGSDYYLTSAGLEVETYFNDTHLQLSGWSIGYRKDDLRYSSSGHMFNGKVFRNFNLKILELKPAFGLEWGMPSGSFNKTIFYYDINSLIYYRQTYPVKNSNVPFIGTRTDGAFYPFAELALLKRAGPLLFEGGMRVNMIRFGIDDYYIMHDHITYSSTKKRILVPCLFVSVGIKMF